MACHGSKPQHGGQHVVRQDDMFLGSIKEQMVLVNMAWAQRYTGLIGLVTFHATSWWQFFPRQQFLNVTSMVFLFTLMIMFSSSRVFSYTFVQLNLCSYPLTRARYKTRLLQQNYTCLQLRFIEIYSYYLVGT